MKKEYRVNRRDNYIIEFVTQSNGMIKIYVRLHPPDCHRRGVDHTHLFSDGHICVTVGREPRSLAQAARIAKAWCEGWSEYCRTGTFPSN